MSDKTKFRSIGVEADIDALVTKEASDIAGQQSLLKDTVGWTGKNLLPYPYYEKSRTVNGITFTVNNDGSVTVNGTATVGVAFNFTSIGNTGIKLNGDYIISGNPAFSASSMKFTVEAPAGRNNNVEGASDVKYTFNNTEVHNIRLWIPSGTIIDNVTIYPMIRKADITDPTYEPYHESVEVMYEEEIHGVNLADSSMANIGIAWNGDTNSDRARLVIPCSPNTEYIASINGTNAMSYIGYVTSPTIIPSQTSLINFVSPASITAGANDRYIIIGFAKTGITQANVDALKFMLRKADIEDSTYRPYNHQAIQNQLNAQGVLGAKNLLPNNATSQTVNGVTFTVNADGSVTANGTASATAFLPMVPNNTMTIKKGSYILSAGDGIIGNYSKYGLYINSASVDIANTKTEKITHFALSADILVAECRIFVTSGTTVSNLTFYPMLRLASDPDDTYQPYAMTNRELTEKVFEKRTLTSADDLNNVTETGIYTVTTAPVNSPENMVYYSLLVQAQDSYNIRQIVFKNSNNSGVIYTRDKGGSPSTWHTWVKFTGTVVS